MQHHENSHRFAQGIHPSNILGSFFPKQDSPDKSNKTSMILK